MKYSRVPGEYDIKKNEMWVDGERQYSNGGGGGVVVTKEDKEVNGVITDKIYNTSVHT